MKHHTLKTIMTFLYGMLLIVGCDNSTGPETPESATISGTITFTGTWPSSDYVYVSLNSTWPPQGVPAASKQILSSDVDVTNNTFSYTFDNVTFGTYGSIAASWMDVTDTNPATNQYTLGAYGGSAVAGFMDAADISCSTTEYSVTGLDFTANLSLAVASGN